MPAPTRADRLRLVVAGLEAAEAAIVSAGQAGDLLVAVTPEHRVLVAHRDDTSEVTIVASTEPWAAEAQRIAADNAVRTQVEDRAEARTWRGRLARAVEALRGG